MTNDYFFFKLQLHLYFMFFKFCEFHFYQQCLFQAPKWHFSLASQAQFLSDLILKLVLFPILFGFWRKRTEQCTCKMNVAGHPFPNSSIFSRRRCQPWTFDAKDALSKCDPSREFVGLKFGSKTFRTPSYSKSNFSCQEILFENENETWIKLLHNLMKFVLQASGNSERFWGWDFIILLSWKKVWVCIAARTKKTSAWKCV